MPMNTLVDVFPTRYSVDLVCGQWVEFDGGLRHQRAASRRRTSAQGTVFTAPLSRSATRRFTSVAHAASASSSTSVSRLSSSDPARAARASVGSASASFRISAASRVTVRCCRPNASYEPCPTPISDRQLAGFARDLTQMRGGGGGGGGARALSSPLPGGVLHHASDH